MQEHNELRSWFTKTFLLQLIQNIIKCPYTINKNYTQNMKRDAETFAQCRSRVLCRYHIYLKLHDHDIEMELYIWV